MIRLHPNVVGSILRRWDGPDGLQRWYYNKWDHYLTSEQILDYRARYGIYPSDSDAGIRIFFDADGYLHVDNCRDADLQVYLESKMVGWCEWAKQTYRSKQGYPPMNVLELIEPYTVCIKDGFWQARYKDKVFNFDSEMRFDMEFSYLPFDPSSCGYVLMMPYPTLNTMLKAILDDKSDTFPSVIPLSGSDCLKGLF